MENTIPSVTQKLNRDELYQRISVSVSYAAGDKSRIRYLREHLDPILDELERDADRYRQGRSAFAHKLMVRADGQSMWRYCEPDPLIGLTFDEAWDSAVESARIR